MQARADTISYERVRHDSCSDVMLLKQNNKFTFLLQTRSRTILNAQNPFEQTEI